MERLPSHEAITPTERSDSFLSKLSRAVDKNQLNIKRTKAGLSLGVAAVQLAAGNPVPALVSCVFAGFELASAISLQRKQKGSHG